MDFGGAIEILRGRNEAKLHSTARPLADRGYLADSIRGRVEARNTLTASQMGELRVNRIDVDTLALAIAQPDWTLLQQVQELLSCRNPLRQEFREFPCLH